MKNFSYRDSSFLIRDSHKRRALVVGSVAFDVLFGVHGTIRDRIVLKNGKLGRQNLMFTAGAKERRFGGTGANIAYGLGILGAKPILFASVGQDFKHEFKSHLENHGVITHVHEEKNDWTATFYGMSDEAKEQIGVWQPNAHLKLGEIPIVKKLGKEVLADVAVAIFTGAPSVIYRHMQDVRKISGKNVRIIFDPGKMMTTPEDEKRLKDGLALADIFIVNDVELHQAEKLLKRSTAGILKLGPKAIIETKGADGSVIYEAGKTIHILARKPKRVVETTGAGDAYRAGLIYGLLEGLDLAGACRIGSYLGSKNVETLGGQAYTVSRGEVL